MYYTHSKEVANSSSIKGVYYDSQTGDLGIEFTNGNYAGYENVPAYIFSNMTKSSSVGGYYNSNVRGIYKGKKVGVLYARGSAASNKIAAEDAETDTKTKFKIIAEVTGGVTIEVRAEDIADALRVAEEQINKAFQGDVQISFKGVNAV